MSTIPGNFSSVISSDLSTSEMQLNEVLIQGNGYTYTEISEIYLHKTLISARNKLVIIKTLKESVQQLFRQTRMGNLPVKYITTHLQLSETGVEYLVHNSLKTFRIFSMSSVSNHLKISCLNNHWHL